MQDNHRCFCFLDTVLRIAMAVSETPRLIVLNQCQMLSPFYAINIHCREPKDGARWKRSKELDCHLLSSPGFRGQEYLSTF